ncbi:MAG: tRNA (adenosine(37)-N6)-dimethylallyltransferase MiaA [Candidatus Pelagadaptatus aseana]|uniref:tRNA (adenosine(37)-N6)-dimethylallyltransferase MiaA n=1 Tax=Candidatus Pelagadaptatus aseana TaxID=3120508 RepID=UPI0039B31904
MASDKPKVLFLMGPTASGKTDLAMAMRQHLPVELISVDSALVYKGLDIGSAKPSVDELALAPHRLLDICDPATPYSAAEFREDALREIRDIHQAGAIPLLVGGTMMYFKALLEGMADMPAADAAVRAEIEAEASVHGWPYVHEQLRLVDPQMAAAIHPNHSQRLSRALEVYRSSGKTMTQLRAEQSQYHLNQDYDVRQVALLPRDRSVLHARIEQRFDLMLDNGFIEEVQGLMARGDLNPDLPAIRAVGYRQVWEYLAGQCSREEMRDKGIAATRQLAKRQITWLRGWQNANFVYIDSEDGKIRKKVSMADELLNFFR